VDTILATVACHSVIRAGDALDGQRALALLQAMDEIEYCPHCPHGRPVLSRLPRAEIERRFGRA
jgi:DNA mismatch repair protein MutL